MRVVREGTSGTALWNRHADNFCNGVNQIVMEPARVNSLTSQSCRGSRRKAGYPNPAGGDMIRKACFAVILIAAAVSVASAKDRHAVRLDANGNLDALIARHAAANNLPEALVRRVIKRESGGNPRVVYKGNFGLMQIKPATARAMGYGGSAAGLLDADTNMTYAVKYLAGAYRAAGGNADRAVHYYAAGYYYAAKRQRHARPSHDNARTAYASMATPGIDR
jgi:soluble lytic murein transglycosylase-like protein